MQDPVWQDPVRIDIGPHERTYEGFVRLLKFGSVTCFAIAFVIVCIIAS